MKRTHLTKAVCRSGEDACDRAEIYSRRRDKGFWAQGAGERLQDLHLGRTVKLHKMVLSPPYWKFRDNHKVGLSAEGWNALHKMWPSEA